MEDTFSLTAVSNASHDEPIPVTHHEERELKRVYDFLCDYHKKRGFKEELAELTDPRRKHYTNADITVDARINEIRNHIAEIEANPDKKISAADVSEAMKWLGQKATKKEVEEMIWECDEDLDGFLNWSEVSLMFRRNIMDKTGLEPCRIYNLVQFLIYDHNENGRVSVDEIMNMLYARFGRAKMEIKLRELFGDNMQETGRGGGEIFFTAFLASVERVQFQTFEGTTKGRLVATKSGGGKKKNKKSTIT